jgi:mono/diheme cytochrome c family protein
MWPETVREFLSEMLPKLYFERARFPAAPQRATKSSSALAAATVFAVIAVLAVSLPFRALAQKPTSASATADLPAGPAQAKATTACTECHEARIILQQRLSKAAWTKEVDKMTKWGALVDPADRDALIDYLSANFGPDKPAYEPPRTADKIASGKSK